jgi:hypothetical protein
MLELNEAGYDGNLDAFMGGLWIRKFAPFHQSDLLFDAIKLKTSSEKLESE